jgi:tetrahydromethanopterin S-methyltransferase subunit G
MKKIKPSLTLADITWLKSEFLPALSESVQKGLEKKLDAIDTKLDKFVGDIQAKREEQTLHEGEHEDIEERVSKIEKHLHFPTAV